MIHKQMPANDLQISTDSILWCLVMQNLRDATPQENPEGVQAWSKTTGVLALRTGESELAAVVWAATEGLGLSYFVVSSIIHDDMIMYKQIVFHFSRYVNVYA